MANLVTDAHNTSTPSIVTVTQALLTSKSVGDHTHLPVAVMWAVAVNVGTQCHAIKQ